MLFDKSYFEEINIKWNLLNLDPKEDNNEIWTKTMCEFGFGQESVRKRQKN